MWLDISVKIPVHFLHCIRAGRICGKTEKKTKTFLDFFLHFAHIEINCAEYMTFNLNSFNGNKCNKGLFFLFDYSMLIDCLCS